MEIEAILPEIRSMGNLIFDPIWSEKNHQSGDCELMHIISGHVNVIMNRQRISAGSGDTVIIPSKTVHRDDFDISSGLEVFMIHFRWKYEADLFKQISCYSLPKMPEPQKESLANLIQHFRHEFISGSAGSSIVARMHLCEILMRIMSANPDVKNKNKKSAAKTDYGKQRRSWLFDKAKEYLENNYQHPIALDDIANELNVSTYHLSHIFSRESDFSLFEFLTQIRMKKARSLLETGELTVSEVAFSVGYKNSNYFSKVFHRYFGFPPNKIYKQKVSFRKA
jgi:AraC-like DNA-binding protein